MLFKRGAVQVFDFLEKRNCIGIESGSTEGTILLSALGVHGRCIDVQQNIVLLGAAEHCVIELSSPQCISCGS